jgi:UDPglucose 6-dehydrogenase
LQCENYHLTEVAEYFRQVIAMNEYQKERFARRILKQMFGTVRRKKILLLGYAFKKVHLAPVSALVYGAPC